MTIQTIGLDDTFNSWRIKDNTTATALGDIDLLTTSIKTSAIAAINELDSLKAPKASPEFTGTAQAPALTLTGSGLSLTNATSNLIRFNAVGAAAPAFTTRSLGAKVVLYDSLSGSSVDYGFGIDTSTLWSSVATTASQFKWYGGTTLAATLTGTGNLTTVGSITGTQFNGSGAGLTSVPNAALVNSSVTIGSTAVALGSTVTAFVGLTSVTSTSFVGALTGNATTATTLQTTRAINGVNFNGSAAITVPVNSVDDVATATTVYPLWTSAAGNTAAKVSSTKLSFVPSTGTLTATAFVGALTGNSTTATTLQTARAINGVNFNGSAAITVPVNSTDDNTLVSPVYPLWTTGAGNLAAKISTTKLSFNPSTGTLTTTAFVGNGSALTALTAGNLTGTIPSAVLGNSTVYIGTTAVALNRPTGALTLGVSITGNAATVTTNANLSGPVYSSGNATSIGNNVVTLAHMAQMATASFLGRNTAAVGNVEVLSTATVRTMLALNNVENTALSTWAGTQNIATTHYLGTTAIAANQLSGTITMLNGISISGNAGTATTATHLSGGVATSIPYQSATGTTVMSSGGSSGQVLLLSNGIPTWSNPDTISAGSSATAANLLGGAAGRIPYQSAADTTLFSLAGTSGQLLTSGGTGAPTWTSPSALTVGNATLAADSTLFGGLATTAFTIDRILGYGNTTTKSLSLGNLTVDNLYVNGTTTTVNSVTYTVDDPVVTLGGDTAPAADDNKDRGVEFRWHNGTVAKLGFFGFDDSTGKLTFIPDATNTSEVFSGTVGSIDAYIDGSMILGGTAGQVLTSGGTWTTASNTNAANTIVKRDFAGNFSATTITAALVGNASTATSIAGGAAGKIPYQSASGTTAFALAGTTGQILISGGTGSPTWVNQNAITLQSTQITNALGFTPYNSTNPAGYITSAQAPVQSVAGRTGVVTLNQADIAGLRVTDTPTFSSVTATSFVGALSGNATTATSATDSTNAVNVAVSDDGTTATSVYLTWVGAATGNQPNKVTSTRLSFVPSTGVLSATKFSGAFVGSGAELTGIPNAALNNNTVTIGTTAISLGGSSLTLAGLTSVDATTFNGAFVGSGASLTSIPNSALVNSSLTIGTTAISLGGSSTTLAGLTSVTSAAFVGPLSGNATTATTLQTARTINGVSFNGSANITIADATKVPLTGATYVQSTGFSNAWGTTNGTSTGAFNAIMGTSSSATWLLSGTSNGVFRGGIQVLDGGGTTRYYTGASYFSFTESNNTITAGTFAGNATTASALQTARTLTIGSTGKTFNGSANVSWTLAEIGAAPTTKPTFLGDNTNNTMTISDASNTTWGASIKLTGNGVVTPSKYIRARSGSFEIVNNGVTSVIMTLTDDGALTVPSTITGSNLSGTNTGDEPAASATVPGIVELATAAETRALTDTTRAVTPADLAALRFESGPYSMPINAIVVAHGLGAIPYSVEVVLVCAIAEHGYSVGDEVSHSSNFGSYSGVGTNAWCVWKSATEIGWAGWSGWVIFNKTTGGPAAITSANWRIKLRASLI